MAAAKRLYAEGTSVPVSRSQQEIIAILKRYDADGFSFGEDHGFGVVAFRARGRMVRFILPLTVDTRIYRTDNQQAGEVRRRWRALTMAIKSKLEVVESGIATFEDEFLANLMLPNGETVGEYLAPQLSQAYANNEMPALLPGASPKALT